MGGDVVNGQTPGNDVAVSSQEQHQEATSKSNGNTKSSLFNTLRSKLPQRTPKQNGNALFNLSPSNFMNKRNSSANNSPQPSTSPPAVPKEIKEAEADPEAAPKQEQNALDTPTDA